MINEKLFNCAKKCVSALESKGLTVATAESCTGGMVASYITSVSGVSDVFELGVVSYSCRIKNQTLGVKQDTLDRFGSVSEQTAREMAENVRLKASASIGISVTGVAGPSASEGHPPGYVFIAVSGEKGTVARLLNIEPQSRNFVREAAVEAVFALIGEYIS